MAVVESLWAHGKAASVTVYVPCEGERRGTVKTAAHLFVKTVDGFCLARKRSPLRQGEWWGSCGPAMGVITGRVSPLHAAS